MRLSSNKYLIGLGGLLALILALLIMSVGPIIPLAGANNDGGQGKGKEFHKHAVSDSVKEIIKNTYNVNELTYTNDVAKKGSTKIAHYKTIINKNQNFVVNELAVNDKQKTYNVFTREKNYFANYNKNCWFVKIPGTYDFAKKKNPIAGLFVGVKSAKVDGDHIVIVYKNFNSHKWGRHNHKHSAKVAHNKKGHYKVVRKTAFLYLNDAHTLPTHGSFKTWDGKNEVTQNVEFNYSADSSPKEVGTICQKETNKKDHH